MVKLRRHVYWVLLRRIGFGLIILAVSGLIVYYFLPPNTNYTTLNPIQSQSEYDYILLLQRNQFLSVQGSCIGCLKSMGLNITIYQLKGDNVLENITIEQIYLNFTSMIEKTISLGPANYLVAISLIGYHTVTIILTGYGIPYRFILTQIIVIVVGIIVVYFDKIFK